MTLMCQLNFDETTGTNVPDETGNGHVGTLAGTPSDDSEWLVSGRINGAVHRDSGSGNKVTIAHHADLQGTTYSVAVGVRLQAFPTGLNALARKAVGGGAKEFTIYIDGTPNPGQIFFTTANTGAASIAEIQSTDYLQLNRWHRVLQTCDGTTLRGYIDGVEQGTGVTATGKIDVTTEDIIFASGASGGMDLDDAKYWGHTLTAAEALTDAQPPNTGLVPSGAILQPLREMHFDGTQISPVTLGAAITLDGLSDWGIIFNAKQDADDRFGMILGSTDVIQEYLWLNGLQNRLEFRNTAGTTVNFAVLAATRTKKSVYLFSYDSGTTTLSLYVDGVLHSSASVLGSYEITAIGNSYTSSSNALIGSIGDVRVLNYAPTAQQATDHYADPANNLTDTIAWYKGESELDVAGGIDTVYDSSTNANHGTATTGVTTRDTASYSLANQVGYSDWYIDWVADAGNWVLGTGWTQSGGILTCNNVRYADAHYNFGVTEDNMIDGGTYRIDFDVNVTDGAIAAFFGNSGSPDANIGTYGIESGNSPSGSYSIEHTHLLGQLLKLYFRSNSTDPVKATQGTISNLKITDLNGNIIPRRALTQLDALGGALQYSSPQCAGSGHPLSVSLGIKV